MKSFVTNHRQTLISFCGVAAVLITVGVLWLTMGGTNQKKTLTSVERVVVTKLLDIYETGGDWGGESIVQRTQTFMVKILTGPYKGVETQMQLDLTDMTGTGKGVIIAKEGDRLLGYFVMDYDTYTLYGTCTGFQKTVIILAAGRKRVNCIFRLDWLKNRQMCRLWMFFAIRKNHTERNSSIL